MTSRSLMNDSRARVRCVSSSRDERAPSRSLDHLDALVSVTRIRPRRVIGKWRASRDLSVYCFANTSAREGGEKKHTKPDVFVVFVLVGKVAKGSPAYHGVFARTAA